MNKKQKITIVLMLIIFSGTFGWLYEVLFYYLNSGMKEFYMRGGNFLPWINIYAYGAFLILFLTHKYKDKPIKVFLISLIATGILEYLSGYILYGILGWTKCWDYNVEHFTIINFGGYACLRSILVFAFSGLLLTYVVLPLFEKMVKSKYLNILFIVSIILCTIILTDEIYNLVLTGLFNIPRASTIYKKIGIKYLYFE